MHVYIYVHAHVYLCSYKYLYTKNMFVHVHMNIRTYKIYISVYECTYTPKPRIHHLSVNEWNPCMVYFMLPTSFAVLDCGLVRSLSGRLQMGCPSERSHTHIQSGLTPAFSYPAQYAYMYTYIYIYIYTYIYIYIYIGCSFLLFVLGSISLRETLQKISL